jgi:hypothetical protein
MAVDTVAKQTSDTLTGRVDTLIEAHKVAPEWGSPRVSTTPVSLAVHQLTEELSALEDAVREIALEVQKLSNED